MFVQDALPGQRTVVRFVRFGQWMLFAAFSRMFGVGMKPSNPHIAGIRDGLDLGPHPNLGILVQTEVVCSTAGKARTEHFSGQRVDYHLSFYRVPLLFARVVPALFFWGRCTGVSVASIKTTSISCDSARNTFLPGRANSLALTSVSSTQRMV